MSAFIQFISKTATTILSLEDAKRQLKIELTDTFDDALIQDCIDAAIDEAESYINTNIYTRVYDIKSTGWLAQNYEIRQQKVTAINKVTYKPANGGADVVLQDTALAAFIELLPVDDYANIMYYKDVDNLPDLITNKNDAVTINITCGYAANAVPKGLLQGIKLLMTENYNIRNNIESKGYRSTALRKLEPYKYYTKTIE